jgi:transcriptional regulator with GAF, ATPase, and Fis domain
MVYGRTGEKGMNQQPSTGKTTGSVLRAPRRQSLYERLLRVLAPRAYADLQRSVQLSADLEVRQQELAERMRVLQDANLSLQRHAMYMDAGVQVMRALMQHFDVDPLLEQAVQRISQHFEFPHVAIFLPDQTGKWLVLRAASSPGGRQQVAQGYRVRRTAGSALARVFETRQPYIARSSGEARNAGLDAAHLAQPGLPGAQSVVLLPLVLAGEALGVVEMHSAEEMAFDQDDLRVLEALAWQMAVALDNAQRLSAKDSVLEMANPFFRLTQRLGVAQTEAEVHSAILELVRGLHPERAYIVQDAEDAQETACRVTDLREATLNVQHIVADEAAENFGVALALGKALETPLFIADVRVPPDLPETGAADFCRRLIEDTAFGGGSHSVALIPLRAGAQFYGLALVGFDSAHRRTAVETQLYRAIAELGGVTLEKLAMWQEMQARLVQEQWLREFSERVLQTSNLETMLAQAALALQDVVSADGVVAALTLPEQPAVNR